MPAVDTAPRLSEASVEKYLSTLKPERRGDYGRYARQFLRFAGGDTSKEALERYRAHLEQHYKPGTVQFVFGVLRRLFIVNGIPWPYAPREAPKAPPGSEFRPMRDLEAVRELIAYARSPRIARLDQFHFAMATVYGLRRAELAMLVPSAIDLERRLIFIRRLKGSVSRWQVMPEAILPVVERALPVLRPVSLDHMDRLLPRLERWAGMPHVPGVSWHAIRRAVVDGLRAAGVPDRDIAVFMGWKTSEHRMVARYAAGVVVDRRGRLSVPLSAHERAADEAVLAAHPFVPAWQ